VDEDVPVIIVTPQKREQFLQDVPIVVTPVSETLLRDTGVFNVKDLTILTPGLTVTSTQNETATTARIRGVGTTGDNPGLESSVGIVIDGVYRPRNGVGFGDIGDLQQIEVIKGPQGTLFGKNTSAGVINIISKAPEFKFEAGGEVGGGNYGTQQAKAYVTGPLIGQVLAGRLYASYREHDGFNTVSVGGGPRTFGEDADRDQTTVRGQLAFRPSANLFIRLIGDYAEQKENCCGGVQLNRNATTAPLIDLLATDSGVANPVNPFGRVTYLNRPTPQSVKDQGASAELNWDLPSLSNATLTSISAYRNWQAINSLDADFTSADIWFRTPDGRFGNEFDTLSQELRLAGQSGRLNWLGGLFYTNEKLDSRSNITYGTAFEPYYSLLFSQGASQALISNLTGIAQGRAYPLNAGGYDQFKQDSDSYALFTNNTFAFTSQFETTLGLRYTREEKSVNSLYQNVGGNGAACGILRNNLARVTGQFASPTPGVTAATVTSFYNLGCGAFADPAFNNFTSYQHIDEDNLSGTAKLAYRFSSDLMGYVSYARGYKASGFNLDREVIQTSASDPNSTADPDTSFSAETVKSYEVGFKTNWLGNAVLFDFALFDQRFNNFQLTLFRGNGFISTTVPQVTSRGVDMDLFWFGMSRALTLQAGFTYADTAYGNFSTPGIPTTLPGRQLSFAPLYSGTLAASYERPLGGALKWRASIAGKGTSSYNTGSDLNPAKVQGAYALVNTRFGLGSLSDRWVVEAYAQNVTNEKYYQVIIDAPLQPGTYDGFLGDPRTYGLNLRVTF
jgi:outer membrane receptor protein involved in Fe transport